MLAVAFLVLAAPTMNFNVIIPALIDVPGHIKVAAMIDRTLVDDETSNVIEGVITGEMFGEDKLGTQILMDGVHAMLENAATVKIKGPLRFIPEVHLSVRLSQSRFHGKRLKCSEKYKVDAIVAIEKFDSDFIIVPGVNQTATVKAGIRMYDPESKSIVDQYQFSHQESWGSGQLSIEAAINGLISKSAAVKEASYEAGIQYGRRLPLPGTGYHGHISRSQKGMMFLQKRKDDGGQRLVCCQRGPVPGSGKWAPQDKGKAAHNLAVVCEIEGNLEDAKGWAQEAGENTKQKIQRLSL